MYTLNNGNDIRMHAGFVSAKACFSSGRMHSHSSEGMSIAIVCAQPVCASVNTYIHAYWCIWITHATTCTQHSHVANTTHRHTVHLTLSFALSPFVQLYVNVFLKQAHLFKEEGVREQPRNVLRTYHTAHITPLRTYHTVCRFLMFSKYNRYVVIFLSLTGIGIFSKCFQPIKPQVILFSRKLFCLFSVCILDTWLCGCMMEEKYGYVHSKNKYWVHLRTHISAQIHINIVTLSLKHTFTQLHTFTHFPCLALFFLSLELTRISTSLFPEYRTESCFVTLTEMWVTLNPPNAWPNVSWDRMMSRFDTQPPTTKCKTHSLITPTIL
jgi:hypothetical protein